MNDNCTIFSPCTWTQLLSQAFHLQRHYASSRTMKTTSVAICFVFLSTHFPITESKTHKMAHTTFLVVDIQGVS
jgi:hypothetical protein